MYVHIIDLVDYLRKTTSFEIQVWTEFYPKFQLENEMLITLSDNVLHGMMENVSHEYIDPK